jgi:DeoR family transcriptional regulator, suf operon transcriptional repressor
MLQMPSALAGYRGLRGELLVALKKSQPITAKELGDQFGLTPNALRRHLKELEAEGMVRYRRVIRGVGGPVYAYSLSENGEALFPRAYANALAQALELVRAEHGTDGVVALFRQQWSALAADGASAMAHLPLGERAQLLAELLTSQGYMAAVESSSEDESTLRAHNCAVREVAERFPEVCAAEATFLEEVLGASVERRAHIVKGDNCCEYCVQSRDGKRRADVVEPHSTEGHKEKA